MNEAYLKSRLCEETRKLIPGVVIFRHEDKFSGGIPDCSFTWGGRTVWVEVKFKRKGNPGKLTELQRLTISRLILHGRAMVVTYVIRNDGSLIIQVDRPTGRDDEVSSSFVNCKSNFNHVGVAGLIQQELTK